MANGLREAELDYAHAKNVSAKARQDVSLAEQRENAARISYEKAMRDAAAAIPVDRTKQELVSGNSVPGDRSHTETKENGQQKDYVVLSADERGKGFVRPYRDAYRHQKCGAITTMSRAIAETYARDPHFYSGTFCTTCRSHFPVGEDGEFTWYEMDGREGPKVGT